VKHEDIHYIVVHCSATRAGQDIDIRTIDRWHRERGWKSCGYHYVITLDGSVQAGRAVSEHGAHVRGHNLHSWGICLVGGLDAQGQPTNTYTREQLTSLRMLITGLRQIAPQAEVLGHRDLSPDIDGDGVIDSWEWLKACPCFDVREWWNGA